MYIEGNFVDVVKGEIYPARVTFTKTIQKIQKIDKECSNFIVPGFIDSHIRFEDSLLSPLEFTKQALLSGVTSFVEDCSGFIQIAGSDGIKYLNSAFSKLPIDYYFLYPINLERNKLESGPDEIKQEEFSDYIKQNNCLGITQVDDIKKIKDNDPLFFKRASVVKSLDKPIISNISKVPFTDSNSLVQLGVRADIGSNVYQDAFEKACYGLQIKIVEGTKRKTLSNLVRLAKQFNTTIVSEEKSAQEISKGYFKATLKKAVSLGLDGLTAIQNVTINPAKLLGIKEGNLDVGCKANIVEIEDLRSFNVKRVFYAGELVVKNDSLVVLKKDKLREPRYKIDLVKIESEDISISSDNSEEVAKVINVDENGNTFVEKETLSVINKVVQNDQEKDILKVVVASRYGENLVSVGYVKGFNLIKGAFGTSLHGSSGNFIAVGVDDESIANVLNQLRDNKGGFSAYDSKKEFSFLTPILGVVSNLSPESIIDEQKKLFSVVKRLGCNFLDPFFVLGNLMNINKKGIRITDNGLVDTTSNDVLNVFED